MTTIGQINDTAALTNTTQTNQARSQANVAAGDSASIFTVCKTDKQATTTISEEKVNQQLEETTTTNEEKVNQQPKEKEDTETETQPKKKMNIFKKAACVISCFVAALKRPKLKLDKDVTVTVTSEYDYLQVNKQVDSDDLKARALGLSPDAIKNIKQALIKQALEEQ
jgi:archaellum component FlaD/FlaE